MKSTILILLISFLWGNTGLAAAKSTGDYVVILHGIARSSSHMEGLEAYLQKQGYDVINLNYPSTDYKLEQLVDLTQKKLSTKLTRIKPVHFVGYSMGGLLVRAIIHKYPPPRLGRAVQLAPPNKGSELADLLKNNWLYQKIYGPAGQQLTTDKDLTHLFGKIDYELGVIAGNRTIDPISSAIIPGDDDGKVSIKSTKLKDIKDHIVVSASHTFFPSNRTVHRQTEHFLKHGVFKKE